MANWGLEIAFISKIEVDNWRWIIGECGFSFGRINGKEFCSVYLVLKEQLYCPKKASIFLKGLLSWRKKSHL